LKLHNFQSIGGGAGARAQAVVENHSLALDIFPEMPVGDAGQLVCQVSQL
jgi:hypothetical protein